MTSETILTSVASLKTSLTKALASQFTVAESEFAVPIKLIGYISALIVHGVEPIPNEKKIRKSATPRMATIPPIVYVYSEKPSAVKAIPIAVMNQLTAIGGVERRIIYLLPNLSIKKIARIVPVALHSDNGMLSTRALLFSSIPEIYIPAF